MNKLVEILEMVLSENLVGWIDTLLLCLGLTLTISSAFHALQSLRRLEVEGERA